MRSGMDRKKQKSRNKRKWPKEVPLGEHTSLGPKATAPITVICLPPDLTLGVSSRTYSGIDTRQASIKFALNTSSPFVNRRAPVYSPGRRQINVPVDSRHFSPELCSVNAKFCTWRPDVPGSNRHPLNAACAAVSNTPGGDAARVRMFVT